MHWKMELLWCKVLIQNEGNQEPQGKLISKGCQSAQRPQKHVGSKGSKRMQRLITSFCVGITCTSVTSATLFESSQAFTTTSIPLSQKDLEPTDKVSQIKAQQNKQEWAFLKLEEFTCLDKASQICQLPQYSLTHASLGEFLNPELKVFSEVSLGTQQLELNHNTSLQAQTPPVLPGNLQPNPNQDRFLQPPPSSAPVPTDSKPEVVPSPKPTPTPTPTPTPIPVQPSPTGAPQTFQVQKINVTGSTVFGDKELNPIVQRYEGRTLTTEQLREVADQITQLYLDRGYITSRSIFVEGTITNGVAQIQVIEGSLEEIIIEGTGKRRVKDSYIRSRIQLGAKTPLNTGQLEDQLRLLRADPLFDNIEASLRAGSGIGKSKLIVRVTEANPFEGSVGIDNYSPPSVGSERLGLNLLDRNLTGNGDAISASYYHTTRSGADNWDFIYRLPLNPMNGALQLRTSLNTNKIVESAFSFFDIQGDSQLYEISFSQPIVRTPREEFSLSLGYSYQRSSALAGPFPISPGADDQGVTKTSVIKFGQDYLRRDVRGAWSVRSLFSIGTDWFGATRNPDPTPDSRFFSWLGQVQRVQVINESNFLIAGADIQLTPDILLPSQQFVIGGGQSLRGYRQNIRAGDNGVRFSLEDRMTIQRNEAGVSTLQLAPFFDAGYVWNTKGNPSVLPAQKFLAGLGMGLIWEPIPKLNLRLDYGIPLVNLKDRGNNAQDEGFYFSVRYQF